MGLELDSDQDNKEDAKCHFRYHRAKYGIHKEFEGLIYNVITQDKYAQSAYIAQKQGYKHYFEVVGCKKAA